MLEEDIALANVGLDLLGQARMWLAVCGRSRGALAGKGRDEDQLAFLRDGGDFRNLLLVELPNGDFADTIARQFLFDAWHELAAATRSSRSSDARSPASPPRRRRRSPITSSARATGWSGSATAPKNRTRGCRRRSTSCGRTPARCSSPTPIERALIDAGIAADVRALAAPVAAARRRRARRGDADHAAPPMHMQRGGKQGVHTEHLGYLLAEMQFLQRAYPGARW